MLVVRREATRLLVIVLSALGLVAGTSSAALASCAPSSTYSQAIAGTSGVISYWRLGDPAGSTTACDSVGSNPGTYETGRAQEHRGLLPAQRQPRSTAPAAMSASRTAPR